MKTGIMWLQMTINEHSTGTGTCGGVAAGLSENRTRGSTSAQLRPSLAIPRRSLQLEYYTLPGPPGLLSARGNASELRLPKSNPPSINPHP
jgi:hypothetical protein